MPDQHGPLGDDLLIGATAIARELGWLKPDGTPNRRRVYHLSEQGCLPIHRVKGLGLCTRKSALKAYFDNLDSRAVIQLDRDSEAL